MTAHTVLVIDEAWRFNPGEFHPVMVAIDGDYVTLTRLGTDERLELSRADWLALVAFVGDKLDPPTLTQSPTAQLLATAPPKRVKKSTGAPIAAQFGPKPFPIDEQAVLARMCELAIDGQMPSRITWDAERGNCPGYATLSRYRKWSAWAQLAGLGMKTKGRRGYDLPREPIGDDDEIDAAQSAAPFRGKGERSANGHADGLSASAIAALGPEHVVVNPLG